MKTATETKRLFDAAQTAMEKADAAHKHYTSICSTSGPYYKLCNAADEARATYAKLWNAADEAKAAWKRSTRR